MTSKQMMAVAVLTAILVWSTVMTVLGQHAAVAALLPSLGLLVQQIISALGGSGARQGAIPATESAAAPTGLEGPAR